MLSQQEKEELGSYVNALRSIRRAIELKVSLALARRVRMVDLRQQATDDLPRRSYVLLGEDGETVGEFSATCNAFSETVQLVEEYFVGLCLSDTEHERLTREFSESLDSLLEKLAQEVKSAL